MNSNLIQNLNFIKQIWKEELDDSKEYIHEKFIRYGKGQFEGPYTRIKKTSSKVKVFGNVDYANILGGLLLQFADEFKVNGNVVSKEQISLEETIPVDKTRSKKGLTIYKIKDDIKSDTLSKAYHKFNKAHFLLNLNSKEGKWKLRSKKSLPKPTKDRDEKFCSADFEKKALDNILEELCFDFDIPEDFKELEISHQYIIEGFDIPEEYRDNPRMARIKAKRVGKIKRELIMEEKGIQREKENELKV